MACSAILRQIFDGTLDVCSLTSDQICEALACSNADDRTKLQMLLTNCEAQGATPAPAAVQDFTPGVIVSTVVATINASRESISISNIGTADGTVNGARLPVGATVSFKAYLDPVTNTYNRVGSISWDASGTEFLIATTA